MQAPRMLVPQCWLTSGSLVRFAPAQTGGRVGELENRKGVSIVRIRGNPYDHCEPYDPHEPYDPYDPYDPCDSYNPYVPDDADEGYARTGTHTHIPLLHTRTLRIHVDPGLPGANHSQPPRLVHGAIMRIFR